MQRLVEGRSERLTLVGLAVVASCGRLGFDPSRSPDTNDANEPDSQSVDDAPRTVDATDAPNMGSGEACLYTNPVPCGLVETTLISGSQSTMDNTTERADDRVGSCARAGGSGELTVRYLAMAPGVYHFSSAGSAIDTALYILDGSCSGPELACNDDATPGDPTSEVVVSVVAGQTIIAVVDGATGLCGAVMLTVTSL